MENQTEAFACLKVGDGGCMSEQTVSSRGQGRNPSASAVALGRAENALARPSRSRFTLIRQDAWRYIIGLGIAWMVLGMAIMPAGVSYNPSKVYQASLILLLYLPALVASLLHGARTWRELLPLPLFRVFLLLLVWAVISLSWAHLRSRGDEIGRLLSVMTFILAWQVWDADDEKYVRRLLAGLGLMLAACAAVYCLQYWHHTPEDSRIVGVGTIATSNYAASLMGAFCLLLTQLTLPAGSISKMRWVAVAVLLFFVGLTQTRAVWLALAVSVLVAPLWRRGAIARWLAVGVLLLAVMALIRPLPILIERGASLRPQLLQQSLHLIAAHPLRGLGQGSAFSLIVDGAAYTHSHNVLTQVAIELGLPGLLLTGVMWGMVGWQGWRHRDSMRGRIVLALWIFASVVMQFDMPQLLDSPRPGWILIWLPLALALNLALRERSGVRAAIMPH